METRASLRKTVGVERHARDRKQHLRQTPATPQSESELGPAESGELKVP